MVIGGAAAIVKKEEVVDMEDKMNVDGNGDGVIGHGPEVLKTEEFWSDLRGYLVQRLKDEQEGDRLVKVFKAAV